MTWYQTPPSDTEAEMLGDLFEDAAGNVYKAVAVGMTVQLDPVNEFDIERKYASTTQLADPNGTFGWKRYRK